MRDGASISASTFGPGKGGNLIIEKALRIELSNGSSISARSLSEDLDIALSNDRDAGKSGQVTLHATDSLRVPNGSSISVETEQADAGDINVNVGNLVHLRNNSQISTSVAGGRGDGGNITIDPNFVVLDEASAITARAREGAGGNIRIRITGDGAFFQSPDSIVSASSDFGLDGTVAIDAPDTDVSRSLSNLPVAFFDPSVLLADRCAARIAGRESNFVATGRGGVPPSPAGLLGASYFEGDVESGALSEKQTQSDPAQLPIAPSSTRSEEQSQMRIAAWAPLLNLWCAR
jgi:large exoprotein involved in heme utilization and adhesion